MNAGVLIAILVTALLVGFAAVSATAADTSGMLYFEPSEVDADPGDTVEVDVMFRTGGGYENEGAGTIEFTVEYDSSVLTATDIEPGPYLEGEGDDSGDEPIIDASTAIDEDDGSAWINQTRTIEDAGVIGDQSAATVTFEIADDAEPTDATLSLTDRTVVLVSGDPDDPGHLQSTWDREGTIAIDGGSADGADADAGDPDGVTLADDAAVGSDEDSSDRHTADEDDPIPGFGLSVALAGLSIVLGGGTLLASARRS